MRKTNKAGIDLIESFEGLRLKAYQDSVGIWTIGYGHTGGVKKGDVITTQQAEAFLKDDLSDAELVVDGNVKSKVNDNQFAAMVSLTYNVGGGNFKKSTLLKLVNAGKYIEASLEFLNWNKAGGKVVPGLSKRRKAEMELFMSND